MTTSQRLTLAALVASMVLGACSQNHQRVTVPQSVPTSRASAGGVAPATSVPSVGLVPGQESSLPPAKANMTLASVHTTMAALHSYSYRAATTTTAQSGSSSSNAFAGNVVSPDRVHYTAIVAATTFEIIRLGATSYRRDPGRSWIKLPAQKNPPPPPAATLLAVLDRLGPLPVSLDGKVSAALSSRDASDAGLASGTGMTTPVAVTLTVDANGHVLHFSATVIISDTHTHSTLRTQTDFADFDKPGDISAPL